MNAGYIQLLAATNHVILTAPHLVGAIGAVELIIANERFGNTVAVAAGSLIVLAHLRRSGGRLLNCVMINLILHESLVIKTNFDSIISDFCGYDLIANKFLDRSCKSERQDKRTYISRR